MSASWQIGGEYLETCSCDYLCPCPTSNLTARPTKGTCHFAMAFHINQGKYGEFKLDDLNFAIVGSTQGPMGNGDWSVGLIVDERATKEQTEALTSVVSGQAGGPLANLAPLIGKFLGVEAKPIQFKREGMKGSVSIKDALDQAVEGVPGTANPNEPIYLDNTLHPANPRLALAKATRSHLHAFGLNWDDTSGKNNGHFAPFSWKNA